MEEISWKLKKEQFISGLNGTSIFEITVISSFSPVVVLARAILLSFLPNIVIKNTFLRYLLDYASLILPITLIVTELSDMTTTALLISIILQVSILLLLWKTTLKNIEDKENSASYISPYFYQSLMHDKSSDSSLENMKRKQSTGENFNEAMSSGLVLSSKLPFLTSFRAYVNIATCICILAVDFHVFPRRLAKAESFGTGLLDLGVGGYIISNAIVCREARMKNDSESSSLTRLTFSAMLFQIFSSWPIVILGMLRLISVKLSGYNEHVTEYGMHWNFFFTLALVKILSVVLLQMFKVKYCLWVSTIIALIYQYILSHPTFNATAILLNDDRSGFLMANKEGLASCIGFLSLYFAGVHLGRFVFQTRHTLREWQKAAMELLMLSITIFVLLCLSEMFIQPISRRFANLSYVLWLLAHSTFFLFAFLLVDLVVSFFIKKKIFPMHSMPNRWLITKQSEIDAKKKLKFSPPPPPVCLIYAISRNQLFYFLFSNLLTGAVNGLVDTMNVSHYHAVIVLCLYNFVGTITLWLLNVKQITLKFW